jgi:enterobactin synthetase component D
VFLQAYFTLPSRDDNQSWLQGVRFSKTHYRDTLFIDYGIDLPDQIAAAMPKRKAEFLAGRLAARKACCDYAAVPFNHPLPIGSDRAPIWPIGLHGSISHCYLTNGDGIAMAACCASDQLVGIDVEAIFSPIQTIKFAHLFTDHQERGVIASMNSGLDYRIALTAVFSAKESFFKAAYPDVQRYFDFDAVKLVEIQENKLLFNIVIHLSDRFKCGDGFAAQIMEFSPTYLVTQVKINL